MNIFQGRVGRGQYFWTVISINVIFALINYMIESSVPDGDSTVIQSLFIIAIALTLIFFSISIQIRRLHDIRRSGWWTLLLLIPIINFVMSVYLIFVPGQGKNKYGAVPPKYMF